MRRLTRYVLAELLKVFAISLVAFTGVVLIGVVAREAIAQGLPPGRVIALIPYVLPEAGRITLPVTLLLAVTTVYARMAGSNEMVAVKSLGVCPMALLWPALGASFLASLAAVWLNDVAVSWGRPGVQRVVIESAEEIAYGMLRTHKRYTAAGFSVIVRDVQGRRLIRPILWLRRHGDAPALTISAEEAELRSDRRRGILTVSARNAKIETEGGSIARVPGLYQRDISLREASRTKVLPRTASSIALRKIPAAIAHLRQEIEELRWEIAIRAAHQMLAGRLDQLTDETHRVLAGRLATCRSQLARLMAEPHRRWSAGFSCLCFAWVGAPMALRGAHRDFLASFFLCFLPILIAYYPLLVLGINGAKNGSVPPQTVWAGNILLVAWGAWLLRRVLRY